MTPRERRLDDLYIELTNLEFDYESALMKLKHEIQDLENMSDQSYEKEARDEHLYYQWKESR